MSSLSTSLKNSYQRWLCPYEEYLRLAKPGVHQQLEQEYGGPLTPSPAPTPIKRSNVNTPASANGDSPAQHASDALQVSLNGVKKETDRDTPMTDAPPPSTSAPSGFTSINPGGFIAVNSGFTSVNRGTTSEPKSFTPDPKRFDSPSSSTKNTPDHRALSLAATALKRQLSCDSSSDFTKKDADEKDDADGGSRRSKRLRKGKNNISILCHLHSSAHDVSDGTGGLAQSLSYSNSIIAVQGFSLRSPYILGPSLVPLFMLTCLTCRCRPHCGWIPHDAIPSFGAKNTTR